MASTDRTVDIQWRHFVSWGDYITVWMRARRDAQRYFNGDVPQYVLDGVLGRRPNQRPRDHVVEYPESRVHDEIENLRTRTRGNFHHMMRIKDIEAMVAHSQQGWGQFTPSTGCTLSGAPPLYSPEVLSDSSPEPGPPAYTETRVTLFQGGAQNAPEEHDAPPAYSP